MGPSTVLVVLIGLLHLAATLPGPTAVHAKTSSEPTEDASRNATGEEQENQCSPLQRRQDLMDNRLIERDSDISARLNGLNTQLSGLINRQNEVDSRLNSRKKEVDARLGRIDSRFDDLEMAMSDMKEYLRQRLDAMEVKAEWALTDTKQKGEVSSPDIRPTETHKIPKDCHEAYNMGSTSSGVYRIAPELNTLIDVLCEQELNGGGWTVFQLRKDGTVDFFRDWEAYKAGFGELTTEFWLGNTNIHLLTKGHDQELSIELTRPDGEVKYANYDHFGISNELDQFRLNVTGYTGGTPPGDALARHHGKRFSTKDVDNDTWGSSCAVARVGAWWYKHCTDSNLNGLYGSEEPFKGLVWYYWKGSSVSMKATKMMVRKRS